MREGWRAATLGDCCSFVGSKAAPGSLPHSLPYVGLEHVTPGHAEITAFGTTAEVSSQVARFEAGDVLFGRLRPYLRKVAFAKFAGAASSELLVLRARPGEVLPGYLHLLASQDSTIEHAVAMSAGSRMPRTSVSDLASAPVLLPPLDVQRRIVDLLSRLDASIACLTQEGAATSRLLQCLADAEFGRVDVPRRALGTAVALGGGRLVDGDWIESKDQSSVGIRLVQLADLGLGVFLDKSRRFVSEETFRRLRCTPISAEDLMISRMADPIGRTALLPSHLAGSIAAVDIAIVSPGEQLDRNYLLGILNSPTWIRECASRSSGSTRTRISRTKLADIEVPFPALTEQQRVAMRFTALADLANALDEEVRCARVQRDQLLGSLLSGEIEIPETYDALLGEVA